MKRSNIIWFGVFGGAIMLLTLVLGSMWLGQNARKDTDEAVHKVSLLYLDELSDRREQVVARNLQGRIQDMQTALDLMTEEDLKDDAHRQAYQLRMKQLFRLEKFAFVDTEGLIYTSQGTQDNIDEYPFDHLSLTESQIFIKDPESADKKVIIATPINLMHQGKQLVVCFMEIAMEEMLSGVSMQAQNSATFCNIYTREGNALSNTVLGGLAVEDNLLEALSHAVFDRGYSYEKVTEDFADGKRGVVSFTYDGIHETLSYVPVGGTDWLLTYLIRESVLSDEISAISRRTIHRSIVYSIVALLAVLGISIYFLAQTRRNARLILEKETAAAESRGKQEELERRLALQDQLLQEEKQRNQQDHMITAMASDYRAVYHVNLDLDDGVCYRSDPKDSTQTPQGVHFPYLKRFTFYAEQYVDPAYREGFLQFIDPERIREGLETEQILAYRYLCRRNGTEYYEMIRVAGVRHAEDRTDHRVHAIGLGLTVIDSEMRQSMAQQQALSDALKAAEQANKAKTVFLSNMSHEIRTPMNAIIGLDSIALKNPDLPARTREQLEKIGGSARHLLGLINDILDMSRIESGRMSIRNEEFSFSEIIGQINTMINAQCLDKGLVFEFSTSGRLMDYYIGDDMKLKQVLINILGNAVKFTPAPGTVFFSVECVAHLEGQSTLRFTIRDTGIGMDKEFLPRVFEAFSQENEGSANKYGSTGLGMAITKSIVELMNGSITVDSERGQGTTFVVTIPLRDSERVMNQGDGVQAHELRVLVIDDDKIDAEHARAVLEELGIVADVAFSGREGLELIGLKKARQESYSLILTDLRMPEQDGIEVTREIRKIIGMESVVVVLTAYSWEDVEEDAKQAGVDSFLTKPLFSSDVLSMLKKDAVIRKITEQSAAPADLNGRRILIAEDLEMNAEIIFDLLELEGMEYDWAQNGRICVEMFEKSAPFYYDAILMDMRMPVMNGLDAARAIRALEREDARTIPIIALTANAFDEDVQNSMQAGMNAHLSKPIES
ncbi:MAG TPA: hypothetical protein DHV42_08825, partial [Lachnospiraceae bacterium]|nr:hypothetical protein [Lachnospiraceae bacterium]